MTQLDLTGNRYNIALVRGFHNVVLCGRTQSLLDNVLYPVLSLRMPCEVRAVYYLATR